MNINGFEFNESNQGSRSPKFSGAVDASRVTRYLQYRPGGSAPAADVQRAIVAICGTNRLSGGAIHRFFPHLYPPPGSVFGFPGVDSLYATAVPHAEPDGIGTDAGGTGQPTYGIYTLCVQYSTLPYLIQGGETADEGALLESGWSNSRFVSKFPKHAALATTLRQGVAKFTNLEGKPVEPLREGLPFTRFRAEINYIWHLVPLDAIPWTAIATCSSGAVNNATFDRYQAGTLLLASMEYTPRIGPQGDRLADINYRMIWMPNRDINASGGAVQRGWNALLRAVGGKARYWPISTDGNFPSANDNRIFHAEDFKTLFQPEP